MGNQYANERARCVSQDKENMQLVFNKGGAEGREAGSSERMRMR